jgi:hypothetical protein
MAKIGEGHLEAMGRLGLKELRNAMTPSRESVADSELGLYGTALQTEIAEQRADGKETMADLRAYAEEKAKEAERGMDGKDQGQERGGR